MARSEVFIARCDRKECKTTVEIDRTVDAPSGWLQIRVEVNGKYDGTSKLEFCSEKCVSIWARGRNQIVSNGRIPQANYRDEVLAAIDIIITNGTDAVTKDSVASVAEIDPSTAGTWLTKLAKEEVIVKIAGEGKRGSPFVYSKKFTDQ